MNSLSLLQDSDLNANMSLLNFLTKSYNFKQYNATDCSFAVIGFCCCCNL